MSVRCDNSTNQGLERLTGVIPVDSDYTCTFWMRTMDVLVSGGSDFRNFMAFLDDAVAYTRWAGLFTLGAAANDPCLEVTNSSGTPSTTTSKNSIQYTWVPIAYSREGNVHSFFYNWQFVASVTVDITAESLITQYLGGDTQYSSGINEIKYFREWDKAKTLTTIQDEWMSDTIVDTDSVWSNCPLISDVNDISGNARNWTNVNTATFVSGDPFTDFNQFFIVNGDPAISPTNKGSWNTAPASTYMLHPVPQYLDIASRTASESSATNPYNLGIARFVSPPLAAQTISGDINMVIGALESNADANFFTRIYIYVTEGDSTTLVRGVLLDFADTSGTEWPTSSQGINLSASQALSSLAISAGDHLVIEFGVRALNSTTSSRTATIWRGCLQENYRQYPTNLTVGNVNFTDRPGWFWFSNPIQLASTEILNLNADRAVNIPDSFPYVADEWTPSTYTTVGYFKHTGVGEKFLSAYNGTAAAGGNEEPQMGIYIYVADTPTNIGNTGTAQLRAWQWPAHDGDQYFFQCAMAVFLNPPGITLTFRVEEFISSQPEDLTGLMLIVDDVVSVNYEPISTYVDHTTGEVTQLELGLPPSENGVSSRINGNIIITGKASPYLGNVYFYDKEVQLLSTDTTTLSASGQTNPPVCETDNFFYAAQYVAGDGVIHVYRWDLDGNLDGTSWDLPLPGSWSKVSVIAVSRDDTILYYANALTNIDNVVKRWDLVNDLALADFLDLSTDTFARDIIVATDDYIYVGTHDETTSPSTDIITKYDSSGTVILEITLDVASYGTLDHYAMYLDDTQSMVVWQQREADGAGWVINTFIEYNVNTGAIINIEEGVPDFHRGIGIEIAKGELPEDYFGIPNSCPLIILLNPGAPIPPVNNPLSGIYKIIPNSFKNTDTLWINLGSEVTEEVEIPNPFIITGSLGN